MDYFGPVVNRAARIGSAAKGGQILLSDSVMEEIGPFMGALGHPQAQDLGFFKLKGLDADQHIFQLLPQELKERTFDTETPMRRYYSP